MSAFLRTASSFGLAFLIANAVFAAPDGSYFTESMEPCELPSVTAKSLVKDGIQLVSNDDPAACTSLNDSCEDGNGPACDNILPICCDPTWRVSMGAIFLHRSRPGQGAILTPIGAPGIISNGGDYGFNGNVGPDVTIAKQTANGLGWEMRYFNNRDSDVVNYPGITGAHVFGVNVLGITSLTGSYISRLDSSEFNVRKSANSVCTLIAGFRWLELHDQLNYSFNNGVLTTNFNDGNHLYGGQLGMDLALLNSGGPFRLNATMKGGAYDNVANHTFLANGIFANSSSNSSPLAFVGDINVTASYQLSRHWAIRGGYQMLWIDRVALASNNAVNAAAAGTGSAGVNNGNLFYYGATAAVDFVW